MLAIAPAMSYHNNQRSASVADKIKRSDDYYLPSGDVIFLVSPTF